MTFQILERKNMKEKNILKIKSRDELRSWFNFNAQKEDECWIIVSIKPENEKILYLDAVEESLCFGWIDGIKMKNEKCELIQRLTPRIKKSTWTQLNIERVKRLEIIGLMTDTGRKKFSHLNLNDFIIEKEIINIIKKNKQTYENFLHLPELYKRIRIDTIQKYKYNTELYNSRLIKFINNTKNNKLYGQWNDNGRLLILEDTIYKNIK